MISSKLATVDLSHVFNQVGSDWEDLRQARIFVTGGTGFFGIWLLESFAHVNAQLGLGAEMVVLTRDSSVIKKKLPHLASIPAIRFHEGDVRSFEFPEGRFTHVIHAATPASVKLNLEEPLFMAETVAIGTQRALEFARFSGAKKFLLTSSGAVYGKQPSELTHVPETYLGAPDALDPRSAYGESKRYAELLCGIYARAFGMETKVARCFAFIGPHLPLDGTFAVGNFIRDGLSGNPLLIQGDGTPRRSYMHAADLAVWLWTLLIRGESGRCYNVGSEDDYSIAEIATFIRNGFGAGEVKIMKPVVPGAQPERYVPSIARARTELGLQVKISFSEAVERTLAWCQTN